MAVKAKEWETGVTQERGFDLSFFATRKRAFVGLKACAPRRSCICLAPTAQCYSSLGQRPRSSCDTKFSAESAIQSVALSRAFPVFLLSRNSTNPRLRDLS